MATDTALTGYDSVNPSAIPATAACVFPYADGKYAWSHMRFPGARWRYITVMGDSAVSIADYEPGCVWPASNLTAWAKGHYRSHATTPAIVYCSRDNVPSAVSAMSKWGAAGGQWHLFLATLDGSIPETFEGHPLFAVQYTDTGAYDMSHVWQPSLLIAPLVPGRAPVTSDAPATYTVVKGDTLSGIAVRTGVPLTVLERLNPMPNPNLIYPGQVLVLS